MEFIIKNHLEWVVYNQFVDTELIWNLGVTEGDCLLDGAKEKIQECYDSYKGCPCIDCRNKHFRYNGQVKKELIESCRIVYDEYAREEKEVM